MVRVLSDDFGLLQFVASFVFSTFPCVPPSTYMLIIFTAVVFSANQTIEFSCFNRIQEDHASDQHGNEPPPLSTAPIKTVLQSIGFFLSSLLFCTFLQSIYLYGTLFAIHLSSSPKHLLSSWTVSYLNTFSWFSRPSSTWILLIQQVSWSPAKTSDMKGPPRRKKEEVKEQNTSHNLHPQNFLSEQQAIECKSSKEKCLREKRSPWRDRRIIIPPIHHALLLSYFYLFVLRLSLSSEARLLWWCPLNSPLPDPPHAFSWASTHDVDLTLESKNTGIEVFFFPVIPQRKPLDQFLFGSVE